MDIMDLRDVEALAGRLAKESPRGAIIWLDGPLGAGKTTFARAFAKARGGQVAATSPTYSIAHRYPGKAGDIWHLDCYRLATHDEAADLDWEGMTTADALLVEWPERAGPWVPAPTCTVQMDYSGDDHRKVKVIR